MRCVICGNTIVNDHDAWVSSEDIPAMHGVCADRWATDIQAQYRRGAVHHAAGLVGVLIVLWCLLGSWPFVVLVAIIGVLEHRAMYRTLWDELWQSILLRWRVL